MDKIILKNIRCTGKRSGSYGNRRRSPKCSYKVGCFGSDTPVRGRTSTLPNPYFYFRFYFLLYPKHTRSPNVGWVVWLVVIAVDPEAEGHWLDCSVAGRAIPSCRPSGSSPTHRRPSDGESGWGYSLT